MHLPVIQSARPVLSTGSARTQARAVVRIHRNHGFAGGFTVINYVLRSESDPIICWRGFTVINYDLTCACCTTVTLTNGRHAEIQTLPGTPLKGYIQLSANSADALIFLQTIEEMHLY